MDLKENAYKPISFWSWNGAMEAGEIREQIRDFKKKGFGGFFIHARAGLETPYLSDEWFLACKVAVDEAKAEGLFVWLYDEDGWPSGFAGGRVNGCGEDFCGKQLRFSRELPQNEYDRILAVYRETESGNYVRISKKEGKEKDLYCYYRIVPHYVDIMDGKVVDKFIESTHEVYRKHFESDFGSCIKGIFTDEPQMPEGPCWSLDMRQKYESLYGADILDELWLLHTRGTGYEAFRYRFWNCANALIRENYVDKIQGWCSQYGLVMTGHFSHEDGLCEQVQANGGVMALYGGMGLPGIDHLGNRYASQVLLKQVSGVAARRGLPFILSESFGCAGWDVSFKELLGIAGWQALFGVNLLCTHLSAYTIRGRRKRDYPAFFSYQEPWWEDMGELFREIVSLNQIIGSSRRETKVAVLSPIRSLWCESAEGCIYDGKMISAQFRKLVEHLSDIHVDFDLLDESEMEQAILQEGNLRVGEASYSLLIIPETTTVSEKTAKVLLEYDRQKGSLIFINQKPVSIEGNKEHFLLPTLRELQVPLIQNTRNFLQKHFRAHPIQGEYSLLDLRMENEVEGLVCRYGTTEEGAILYVFNPLSGHDIKTIFRHTGFCQIQQMNFATGTFTDVEVVGTDRETYATLSVEEQSGILLKVIPGKEQECSGGTEKHGTGSFEYELEPLSIQLSDYNSLTLDCGRYSFQGQPFSERMANIHMLDEIYAKASECRRDTKVCIEYRFFADFRTMPAPFFLAAEKTEAMKIEVNGKEVCKEVGWWIDKSIRRYDISGMVVEGENVIYVHYLIPGAGKVNDTGEKFESERNRFFYDIEPENVYLCGLFDVTTENYASHINYYRTEPTFTLRDYTPKRGGDLTAQNLWFYRGNCTYEYQLHYRGEKKVFLSVPERKCTLVEVCVNDQKAGMLLRDEEQIDITSFLSPGVNRIRLIAKGHNRNLFGPHHHIRGDVHFVGPHTFEGVRGFEDFMNADIKENCTWTEEYSFVPFGISKVRITGREKK